ncbi:MAG: GNAT family N-acetyltransferase [Myxococcaceae bacterium]|nr:GNAT family N-acetyltransferase [Myxococcaceae bacterium]
MPRLVVATEAQRRARDVLTASAWGRLLRPAQFLDREVTLRAHPFAVEAMRTWLWVEGDEVCCSCETFEVRARRGPVEGRAWLVASVFTEPRLRGRGFARSMLDALALTLTGPGALALALFSEVGAPLYERAGFVAQPTWDVVLPAETSVLPTDTWRTISAGPAFPPAGDGELELILSDAQCAWHVERERFYAKALGRPAPTGHLLVRGSSSLAAAASFQTNELHVLWYDFQDDGEAESMLREACAVAGACGLGAVRVWETTRFPVPSGGARRSRDDELPMVRPLDGGAARWTRIARGLWA